MISTLAYNGNPQQSICCIKPEDKLRLMDRKSSLEKKREVVL